MGKVHTAAPKKASQYINTPTLEVKTEILAVNSAPAMPTRRSWMVPVGILFVAQIAVIASLGTRTPGRAFALLIELAFNLLCAYVFSQAARRSTSLARYFWLMALFSVAVFCVSLLLSFYVEVIRPSPSVTDLADIISIFWFGPVSLTLFLEPDFQPACFDRIHILDFIQVILFWVAIYFFFLYLPTHEASASVFAHTWLRSTWAGSLVYDGAMAAVFLLRSVLTNSPVVRALFGRIGLFLVFVGLGDFYYNFLGTNLQTGSWYEVIWTLLDIAPIAIAATWNETEVRKTAAKPWTTGLIGNRLFPILFSFLVLVLSMYIVREHTLFALLMVALSFGCSSLRLIIIQKREHRIAIALHAEIAERKRVEQQLREHEEHLEEQVAERTARLEESNTRLRQAQKMEAIGKLAGGIAHDFNNLLTVIKGYSRLILDRSPDHELRSEVQQIDDAAERAASLTHQLLAFSRRQVLQPKIFNINTLVLNLDKMLRRLIGEDIEMVTVPAPDLGSVKADPGQLEQVILNLVVNARDAMPNGGKLTLEMANVDLDDTYVLEHPGVRPGRYVMLAVTDTGTGMDRDTLASIFEPFFTTKDLGKGTGLGLSTVYGIVKQSGGNIWAYSEPGRGTTFKIYLPWVDAPPETLTAEQRPLSNTRGNETILLVEDDQRVRDLAQTVLSASGYSVLAADNPSAAISLCQTHAGPLHLLLTDIVMPGLCGRELARQLTARRPGLKVLYMSGYTTNAIVHHGELDSSTFFLPKPFTPASLAAKVREVLDAKLTTKESA